MAALSGNDGEHELALSVMSTVDGASESMARAIETSFSSYAHLPDLDNLFHHAVMRELWTEAVKHLL